MEVDLLFQISMAIYAYILVGRPSFDLVLLMHPSSDP